MQCQHLIRNIYILYTTNWDIVAISGLIILRGIWYLHHISQPTLYLRRKDCTRSTHLSSCPPACDIDQGYDIFPSSFRSRTSLHDWQAFAHPFAPCLCCFTHSSFALQKDIVGHLCPNNSDTWFRTCSQRKGNVSRDH